MAVSETVFSTIDDFPKTGSGFGVVRNPLTLYEGFTIPEYSRCIFINYTNSNDGALIAIISDKTYTAFRNNGKWQSGRILVTNTDLGNATFWFPTFVLGWDSYTNGTHQLTQSIANKPLLICAGKNGSLSGFWAKTQANDDRVIMTPEGAITIHFDSLTQVTITGATSTWNVRSIQIF